MKNNNMVYTEKEDIIQQVPVTRDKSNSKNPLEDDQPNLSSKDILKGDLDKLQSTCETYVLSKKYNSLQSLENDNNKLIYCDAIYDNTFYSMINDYKRERENMDYKQFIDFIANKLTSIMNLTKVKAYREAKAIVDEKREIIDGDYAVLSDKGSAKNYIYIR
jgi:hypothetical protein